MCKSTNEVGHNLRKGHGTCAAVACTQLLSDYILITIRADECLEFQLLAHEPFVKRVPEHTQFRHQVMQDNTQVMVVVIAMN